MKKVINMSIFSVLFFVFSSIQSQEVTDTKIGNIMVKPNPNTELFSTISEFKYYMTAFEQSFQPLLNKYPPGSPQLELEAEAIKKRIIAERSPGIVRMAQLPQKQYVVASVECCFGEGRSLIWLWITDSEQGAVQEELQKKGKLMFLIGNILDRNQIMKASQESEMPQISVE